MCTSRGPTTPCLPFSSPLFPLSSFWCPSLASLFLTCVQLSVWVLLGPVSPSAFTLVFLSQPLFSLSRFVPVLFFLSCFLEFVLSLSYVFPFSSLVFQEIFSKQYLYPILTHSPLIVERIDHASNAKIFHLGVQGRSGRPRFCCQVKSHRV